MNFNFVCKSCGKNSVVVAPIGSSPKVPSCGCGGKMNRKFAPLPVIYRCSGFYHTDKALYDIDPDDDYE